MVCPSNICLSFIGYGTFSILIFETTPWYTANLVKKLWFKRKGASRSGVEEGGGGDGFSVAVVNIDHKEGSLPFCRFCTIQIPKYNLINKMLYLQKIFQVSKMLVHLSFFICVYFAE